MTQKILSDKCDLYRLLLHPEEESADGSRCIEKALSLVTGIVDARLGFIEVSDDNGTKFWSALHCDDDDVEAIRMHISSTIIAEALSTGDTVVTPSALLDDRFSGANSVIQGKIESVLCSPISTDGVNGVIYLQGELSGLCDKQNVDEAELFTHHIQPLLKRLKYNLSRKSPEDDLRSMYKLDGVIGRSKSFLKVLNEAMTIAPLDVSLLMNGETGTGKSHLAKVIHLNSSRENQPFIHINCANIPESLFESELFGAAKGAYSGATGDIEGKVLAADGGTLFLDEISEMPISAQAKLLQFLEEGFFFPLGSSKKVCPDVRVILASNADFKKRIADGTFREDLYYRIANFPINVPALRERKEDIPELAAFFIKSLTEKFKYDGFELTDEAMTRLKAYEWPGNIREIQNKLQQGLIKAKIEGTLLIKDSHLFPEGQSENAASTADEVTFSNEKTKWEKQFISDQLDKNAWNVTRTAASLKMSRSHLNRLIKDYDLKKSE